MPFQRSPLIALSFYVASSVYVSQAQEEGITPIQAANIELLLTAMEAIGKTARITLSFLRQAISELKDAGLDSHIRVPKLPSRTEGGEPQHCGQIPLFARSRLSKRTMGILPPLPGRLPLNKPLGTRPPNFKILEMVDNDTNFFEPQSFRSSTEDQGSRNANKRRRVNLSPEPSSMRFGNDNLTWCQHGPVEEVSSSENTPIGSSLSSTSRMNPEDPTQLSLPHRAGSSTSGSSPSAAVTSSSTSMSSGVSPGYITHVTESQAPTGGHVMAEQADNSDVSGTKVHTATDVMARANNTALDMFQSYGIQASCTELNEVTEAMLNDTSWMILNDLGVNSQTWDTSGTGAGAG